MYSISYLRKAKQEILSLASKDTYTSKIKHTKKDIDKDELDLYTHYITTSTEKNKLTVPSDLSFNKAQINRLEYLLQNNYSDEYILHWLSKELHNNIYMSDNNITKQELDFMLRQWFRKTPIIGKGEEGVALLTTHTGLDIPFVLKVKQDKETTIHEFVIGKYIINHLRKYNIPNFVYTFGIFDCSAFVSGGNISKCICVSKKNTENKRVIPNRFIIQENINNRGDMINACKREPIKNIYNYFLQCVFASYSAYKLVGFSHNDLHTGNVLIRDIPQQERLKDLNTAPTIHYTHPNVYLKCPTGVATIVDLGLSSGSVDISKLEDYKHHIQEHDKIKLNKNDKKLLGKEIIHVDKTVKLGVSDVDLFAVSGIIAKKSNPLRDFFKLLVNLLYDLFHSDRQEDAMVFKPVFEYFNKTDKLSKETIDIYMREGYGYLIEGVSDKLDISHEGFISHIISITNKLYPEMIEKNYEGGITFDCSQPNNLCLRASDNKHSTTKDVDTKYIYNTSLVSIYYNTKTHKTQYSQQEVKDAVDRYYNMLKQDIESVDNIYKECEKLYKDLYDICVMYYSEKHSDVEDVDNEDIDNLYKQTSTRSVSNRYNSINNTSNRSNTSRIKSVRSNRYNSTNNSSSTRSKSINKQDVAHCIVSDFSKHKDKKQTLETLTNYLDNMNSFIEEFRAIEQDLTFLTTVSTDLNINVETIAEEVDNDLWDVYNRFKEVYLEKNNVMDMFEYFLKVDEFITHDDVLSKSVRTSVRNRGKGDMYILSKSIENDEILYDTWFKFMSLSKYLYNVYSKTKL